MSQDYTFSVDVGLRINSWGEEISKLTGKTPSSAVGRKYYEVFPRISSSDRDSVTWALEKNRKLILDEYHFQCPMDHFSAGIRIEPLRTMRKVTGAKVTIFNLSPCSAVRGLRNSQLFIDIGKTASALAHGVRNPLNAIKGAVVFLSEKYAKEPALVEFAGIINEEIARLDNFISLFLSTSISGAGASLTDLNALLKKIEAVTCLQAHAYNIRMVYEYGDIPPIMVNAFQIEQAILNVINNALEAMRSDGQLTVKTGKEERSGTDFVVIEIRDTGPGMAQNIIDRLSLSPKETGRGFGLFITREILQYYGGHLEIRSKKGQGSTVMLYLPIRNGERA